jgi:hypothetical protein
MYIYITRLASNDKISPSNKIRQEVGRAKDLSAPLYIESLAQWGQRNVQHTETLIYIEIIAVKTGSLIQLFNGSKMYNNCGPISNVVQLKCGSDT